MTSRSRGGLKVTKSTPHTDPPKNTRCVACNGSGYYDDTDRRGRPIKYGACGGTGKD